jgi:alpha-D-ribose 1-methylphosphonate 5-triphosphate synthase subunit PhnG
MAVLARADAAALESASAGLLPAYALIRGPEAGLVMVRGRAGGSGAPFNVGEATVVRCTVRSASGHLGHAYCLGRDLRQAELAAAIDAGLQDPALRPGLQEVVDALADEQTAARTLEARRAAATQVQFFTMATMRS